MKLAQESRQVGPERWEWAVWIDGSKAQLDTIESVEYTLHPTFPTPVRVVEDRSAKFRLEEWGSGEFEIRARVHFKTGRLRTLKHWLELDRTRGARAPAKTVFVSYAAADADLGEAIRGALAEHGVRPLTLDEVVEAGKPWEASLTSAIDAADLVVAVFTDAPSQWVEREVKEATASHVDVVPMVVGDSRLPGDLGRLNTMNLRSADDVGKAVDALVSKLGLQ